MELLASSQVIIPHVIHHIWFDFGKHRAFPSQYEEYRNHIRTLHPNWEMHLWTDASFEPILSTFFLPYASLYHSLLPVQKTDLARYMILYLYGGIYLDTDIICSQPLDTLLTLFTPKMATNDMILFSQAQHVPSWLPKWMITNSTLVSTKFHPFWLELLMNISFHCQRQWWMTTSFYVTFSTGPLRMSLIYSKCSKYLQGMMTIERMYMQGNTIQKGWFTTHLGHGEWINQLLPTPIFYICFLLCYCSFWFLLYWFLNNLFSL